MMLAEEKPMRLECGNLFPDFTVTTQKRDNVQLHDIVNRKTVFWIIRYIGCTVCRYDVHLLMQKYHEIAEAGYDLFVVMQSDKEHVIKDLKDTDLPFEIICDSDQQIYQTLQILPAESSQQLAGDSIDLLKEKISLAREAGFTHGDYEGNELQLPALFIVDGAMDVTLAHYGTAIMDMPTVDELITMLADRPEDNMNADKCRQVMHRENLTIVIADDDGILLRSRKKGILPMLDLLELMETTGCRPKYQSDRILGKAASIISLHCGIREVYSDVVSQSALDIAERNGIAISYETAVPMILNPARTQEGPFEVMLHDVSENDFDQAMAIIRETSERIRNSQNRN